METTQERKHTNLLITVISIAVPLVVAILLAIPSRINLGDWTTNLPHIIGFTNTVTSVTLIIGFVMIKRGNVKAHRLSMTVSFCLGLVFLVCYVTYHISNPSNKFPGSGAVRYIYLLILASHVLLSIVVLPFVLRAASFAMIGDYIRHKRTAKWAFPIWLYVSITGVVVYLMLYHLY
ncbi:MAG: DUF420 domain-containing protein [Pyrinomonadaceae bacterium]